MYHEHDQNELEGSGQAASSVKHVSVTAYEDRMASAFNQTVNIHDRAKRSFNNRVYLDFNGLPIGKPKKKPQRYWLGIIEQWYNYIGLARLEDWQRLCRDMTLEGELNTEQDCKDALEPVWVNLVDFLYEAEETGAVQIRGDLKLYVKCNPQLRKGFPKEPIIGMENSPMQSLLAYVISKRPGEPLTDALKKVEKNMFKPWPLDDEHWVVKSHEFAGKTDK